MGGATLADDDYTTTSTFDALGQQLSERSPSTPGTTGGQATQLWTWSELGGEIEHVDYGSLFTATTTDAAGRALATWIYPNYTGGTPGTMTQTSATSYDASGRVTASRDANQVADLAHLGETQTAYDDLGRAVVVTEGADAVSGDGITPAASQTVTGYDALGRATSVEVGYGTPASQLTATAYDLGGRALRTDDGFACSTTSYDWRGLATQTVTGLTTGSCSGGTPLTTTITSDGLGRVTLRSVDASNQPESVTYDAAGNRLASSAKQGGTTTGSTFTLSPLDQMREEDRSDGSTTKTSHDPAGNTTDTCYWRPGATVGSCLPADTASWTNAPDQASTVASDARNQRISLTTRLGSASAVATTTYDPAHNYQVSRFYLPTHYTSGQRDAEAQDLYAYDSRHRLTSITHQACAVAAGTDTCTGAVTSTGSSSYAYDEGDNRVSATESSTGGTATTRYYCHDGLNRLTAVRAGAACTASPDEAYAYDGAGNRTSATSGGSTRAFSYGADGQLDSCANPACSVSYWDDGRARTVADNGVSWTFAYDADGRMTSACAGTTCSGSGFDRVDWLYDGEGHRTRITETASGGAVTVTDLRYQGDAVVQESVGGSVTRTYALDDAGRIVEVCDPDCGSGTVYVVAWSGHGDATGLWRRNGDGSLALANSYTYSTWGTPATTVAAGFSDLRFRYLWVGASDVQWDNQFGLGRYYMHARSYSPSLGRFLQPDPARADGSLYAYGGDSPVTDADPSGLRPGYWQPYRRWFDYSLKVRADVVNGVCTLLGLKYRFGIPAAAFCAVAGWTTPNMARQRIEVWVGRGKVWVRHYEQSQVGDTYQVGRFWSILYPDVPGGTSAAARICGDAVAGLRGGPYGESMLCGRPEPGPEWVAGRAS